METRSTVASAGSAKAAAVVRSPEEEKGALFTPNETAHLRARWDSIQVGFVDEPRKTVEEADELVSATLCAGWRWSKRPLEGVAGPHEHNSETDDLYAGADWIDTLVVFHGIRSNRLESGASGIQLAGQRNSDLEGLPRL